MAYDVKAFEGDWWYLVEEEVLEHAPDQMVTLTDGKVMCEGALVGSYAVADDKLKMTFTGSAPYETVIHLPAALDNQAPALDHLQGNIAEAAADGDGPFFTYCTMTKAEMAAA